jgi:uncharacterized protein (DUF427 family)
MSSRLSPALAAARGQWRWRGAERPPFAEPAAPGQESVWDFPRPPRIEAVTREIVVRWGDVPVARTTRARRVLETAHPPSYYLPWDDVDRSLFEATGGGSVCEWKGAARYWSLVHAGQRLQAVAWSYPQPLEGAEVLAECVAMYPHSLACTVGGMSVRPQPGAFYGGWITPDLAGPFKGEPGSEGW